jgi:hypothetical protein
MSIIAEALRKAAREKEKTITSKEYLDRILGPERKESYKRKERKSDKSQLQPKAFPTGAKKTGFFKEHYAKNKTLIASGILLLITIIFLTVINIFLVPSGNLEQAGSKEIPTTAEEQPVAEAYTDVSPELVLIENVSPRLIDKMTSVFKSGSIMEEFTSNFTLNGIVYDTDEHWAIINNHIVRVGETLDGATVVSIAPHKVTLLFKNERFDLAVK